MPKMSRASLPHTAPVHRSCRQPIRAPIPLPLHIAVMWMGGQSASYAAPDVQLETRLSDRLIDRAVPEWHTTTATTGLQAGIGLSEVVVASSPPGRHEPADKIQRSIIVRVLGCTHVRRLGFQQ
jgi:hypothetical protein